MARRGAALVAAVAASSAILGLADRASAGSVRVPADYFGVNFQNPYEIPPELRDAHLRLMRANGVKEVRVPLVWASIEPYGPTNAGHSYHWDALDRQVAAIARHGIRVQAMLAYAPRWAASGTSAELDLCRLRGVAGLGAGTPKSYAALAKAVARRYGVGGDFWDERPTLPGRPMRVFEIWNAPNTVGTWCPRPDPEGYGIMFALAAEAIHQVNQRARVVVGGVGLGGGGTNGSVATDEFLRRMVAAEPAIRHLASAVGVHAYPGKRLDKQLIAFPKFRAWIREAGFPDRVPMLVNELGFSRAGEIDMTESERVASYRNVTSKLSRTNCNINGILPYAWMTRERSPGDAEEWFGIASPGAVLYPSGHEFVRWVDIFRGNSPQEAPRKTLRICDGMPLPDQDGDGIPDEDDATPLGPIGGGGGGGGAGGGGGGHQSRRCTIRGTPGPDKLVGTRGGDVICGRGGNDVIFGRRGHDTIIGGRGSDVIVGGRGRDILRGSRGSDLLRGGPGADRLSGGRGRDYLIGGPGLDLLKGGPGRDRLRQ